MFDLSHCHQLSAAAHSTAPHTCPLVCLFVCLDVACASDPHHCDPPHELHGSTRVATKSPGPASHAYGVPQPRLLHTAAVPSHEGAACCLGRKACCSLLSRPAKHAARAPWRITPQHRSLLSMPAELACCTHALGGHAGFQLLHPTFLPLCHDASGPPWRQASPHLHKHLVHKHD